MTNRERGVSVSACVSTKEIGRWRGGRHSGFINLSSSLVMDIDDAAHLG